MFLSALRPRPRPKPPTDPSTHATSDHDTERGARSPWRSLRYGSFRLWTVANAVSSAGTWMQMVAQNLLVLQLTGSVTMTGLSASAQAAPGLLFGLLGGAVVDKYSYRLVAGMGQVALAMIAFTTASLAALDLMSVGAIMVLGVLSGLVGTADGPAVSLLGNDLVPRKDLPSAIAVGSAAMNLGRLGGTALAGAAISWFSISGAYLVNGLSFLLVAASIPFLRSVRHLDVTAEPATAAPTTPPDAADLGVRAGLRYLLRSRALVALAAIGLVTTMLGRNYSMSTASLVTGPLGGDAAGYGQVATALAVGGILGALLAGLLRAPGLGVVLAIAVAGAGLQTLVGLSPALLTVVLLAVPMAAAEGALATGTSTMLQTVPPESMRGRVLGTWRTVSTSWGLAGPPCLGAILELLGTRGGLVAGGLVSILLLGVVAAMSLRGRTSPDSDDVVVPLSPAAPSRLALAA